MSRTTQAPWATGPGEILKHGLELLRKDTDTNRRLAMISIDNAVELMVKTYLGLPRRVTGLRISRGEYQQFAESFPKLLDALEKYAADKLDGIDLGEIEWYHRIRNQLYHQGNGLTVERDKVEVYAELANVLFANLFGFRLVEPEEDSTVLLGEFMQTWVDFEKLLSKATLSLGIDTRGRPIMPLRIVRVLEDAGFISKAEITEINYLRQTRNEVVHGVKNHKDILSPEIVDRLRSLTVELEKRLQQEAVA
ncbi:MAG: hypothetical protein U9M97_03900 [Candidatus Hadarchaeota archaeon]|nr:hypothetical protein [Candidatus Hadarchaeota archaeon]